FTASLFVFLYAHHLPHFFFLVSRRPPTTTLFPYTTLFRSHRNLGEIIRLILGRVLPVAQDDVDRGLAAFEIVHVGLGICSVKIEDRKSTRLNSSHVKISYAVFCLKKKKKNS